MACDRGSFVGEAVLACHRSDRRLFAVDHEVSDEFSSLASTLQWDPPWRRRISQLSRWT
jgi:hypothetical protein